GADTVTRLLAHLREVLVQLPREERIENVDLVNDAMRARFAKWNDTTADDIPTDVCIHQLFVERALVSPHAVAVRDSSGAMTYEDLLRRSVALARELRARGVSGEELVGVRLPKGRGQVIATLGIMMAGGAYLPMEV